MWWLPTGGREACRGGRKETHGRGGVKGQGAGMYEDGKGKERQERERSRKGGKQEGEQREGQGTEMAGDSGSTFIRFRSSESLKFTLSMALSCTSGLLQDMVYAGGLKAWPLEAVLAAVHSLSITHKTNRRSAGLIKVAGRGSVSERHEVIV